MANRVSVRQDLLAGITEGPEGQLIQQALCGPEVNIARWSPSRVRKEPEESGLEQKLESAFG